MTVLGKRLGLGGLIVVTLCAVLTVAVPLSFPADGGATDVDREIARSVHRTLDDTGGVYQALVFPSNGYIVIPLWLAAVAWFVHRRRWWRAATMFAVPELALAVNTWVLKPLWDRPLADYLAYPSGHTVHLVAVATTFVLLTDSPRVRRWAAGATVFVLCGVAVGMIGLGYHHATDVLGGVTAAVAMATALCRLADFLAARRVPH
ncbi:phosphatase PAP2 family protein [Nocardia goodfellowii]|uniref:Undecaprenyl-diphosphatase n=1 Tax=Nocardia goodfellowii TaxID=882446 RepID=A0ABS4QLE3_9NOCA|nr:phosphatase PAP2 family protein [Nocardia goodfellowii]MBP2192524.1 undecaprenyl-diphosphatase [Nocardia goodfellowii]